jgi:uncharacterized peroxidase-related enzyme
LLRDDDLLERIERDWRSAALEPRRHAMLAYAEKLTRSPSTVTRADVETLRKVGFSDRDVLEIVEVTAYFAYVNRIADGLGVELEPGSADSDGAPGE